MTTGRLLVSICVGVAASGCAPLAAERAYSRITLGVGSTESLLAALPNSARRTTVGLACFEKSDWAQVETALVVLDAPDGRAQSKFLVTLRREGFGPVARRRVALDAVVGATVGDRATPGAVARVLDALSRLGPRQGQPGADRAHTLVAAAMVRLLECLPDVRAPQAAYQRYAEALSEIPANGTVAITTAAPDAYAATYRATGPVP